MTREEAFNRLEQMYDFYAHAMDSDKNHPFEGDAEAIKVALLVIAQDRSAHITREQVEVEDRWAYMEDGSAVCPRCGKRYERRKFEFVGACCEACGANNIVKTEIKEDE